MFICYVRNESRSYMRRALKHTLIYFRSVERIVQLVLHLFGEMSYVSTLNRVILFRFSFILHRTNLDDDSYGMRLYIEPKVSSIGTGGLPIFFTIAKENVTFG